MEATKVAMYKMCGSYRDLVRIMDDYCLEKSSLSGKQFCTKGV